MSQATAIMAAPLLTRLYSPSDFGALAIFISILSLLVVVVSLNYQLAIPLAQEDKTAVNILAVALISTVVITITTSVLLFFFGDKLASLLNVQVIVPYLWFIPASLFGAGIYQVLSYWALRKQEFARLARTKINQGIVLTLTQIIAAFITKGPFGLILGDALGRSAGSGSLVVSLWKRDRLLIKGMSLKGMKEAAMRYRKYPLISSVSGLVNSAGLQVLPFLLAAHFGATVVGWFALTQRIIGIPMGFIGLSVAQVYVSEASRLVREQPNQLINLFFGQARKLAVLGGFPIILFGLSAPFFFSFVFGSSWEAAGRYAQILSFMFSIQFVVAPLSQTLNILEHQSLQLLWDICRLLAVLLMLLICVYMNCSVITIIFVYSITMSLAYLVLFALSYYVIRIACDKSTGVKA